MKKLLGAAVIVLVGVGVFGIVMQPSVAERLAMAFIFTLMALSTIAAAVWLPRLSRANRSLKSTFMILSVVSFVIVVTGLLAAGQQMFISAHDLTLLLIVIGFGVVAAVSFAFLVSGPLAGELEQIADAAAAIAMGDLEQQTDVGRSDEIGELARAIDEMSLSLRDAQAARERDDAARRELFAAVGHDLRTPLASLQVAIEAVQDGMTDDPDRYLDSMRRDTEALARLVDDLFLLARLESGDLTHDVGQVDLAEAADEAVELLKPLADEREISVHLVMASRVNAIATQDGIARVIRNLLDNAIRHSPRGGEIRLSLSNGRSAMLEIVDQGEGFSVEFVEHAFERFSRGNSDRNRANGGAGLGLAIARRYVEDFGGRIWATPGPGGRVTVELPGPSPGG